MNEMYKNAKIVVIDDIEQVLQSVKNRLEFEDMNVTCFSNPIEGMEYLKNNKVDVLLLDFFMPEMNGDEFVEKLREFNNETIVILQTGYSDKIPPIEIIDKMNIQGYLDKLKGEEELLIMTKSAIKTAMLKKEITSKNKQIDELMYKKLVLGDLVSSLINESKSQLFQISAMLDLIQSSSNNEFEKECGVIKNATSGIGNFYDAINFEKEEFMTAETTMDTIKELLKAKLKLSGAILNTTLNAEKYVELKGETRIIYIIIYIIEHMLSNNSKNITLEYNEENGEPKFIVKADQEALEYDKEKIDILKGTQKPLDIQLGNEIIIKI